MALVKGRGGGLFRSGMDAFTKKLLSASTGADRYQQTIHLALSQGWRVELQTEQGATLSCNKKVIPLWARACMVLGLVGLLLYGLGVLFLIPAIIGYAQAPRKTCFVSAAQPVAPGKP